MSRENVEVVVWRFLEAFNRREQEPFLACLEPNVSFRPFPADETPVMHGHDGMREWWDNLLGVFPDMQMTLLDLREFGDQAVAHIRNVGTGGGSGVSVDAPTWTVFAVTRDGTAAHWASFRTEAEALQAIEPSDWRSRLRLTRRRRQLQRALEAVGLRE